MKLTRRVSFGGVQLDTVDASIVVRSADPGVPQESVSAAGLFGGWGQRITSRHWDMIEASVTFAIDLPKKSVEARRTVFDKAIKWAANAANRELTMTPMGTRKLIVDSVVLPGSGDLWNWTDEYTIGFRAYFVPFWQDATATTVTDTLVADTEKVKTVSVPGSAPNVLDVSFKNTANSATATFEVNVNGKTLKLTSLALANGKYLLITHGTDDILRITEDGVSAYGKQTAGGAEDLYLNPGNNTVKVKASTAGEIILSCKGRYL